ncbi:hypothetical protein Gorai_008446 [Gossypium raimondii]|uniref:Cytochrome b5 heme-binding domain-containing protein n=2 Tax=Gossypium TaxID=3633 RepID=A0A7J8QB69_GOSRA|nr:hypothetical protein [Gossypium raimondii]
MDLTPQQLIQFNGSDPSKPIYVAINGRIYDVTAGKSFYGPGGAYAMFAGKDASRALAKMSKNEEDVCPNLDGLSEKEMDVLNDWVKKFEANFDSLTLLTCEINEEEEKNAVVVVHPRLGGEPLDGDKTILKNGCG